MSAPEFEALVRAMHAAREAELIARFDRSLPFADGLFDRWERAKRLGFGEGASIYDSSCVFGDVRVGAKTWVGPFTVLDGSGGGITIGSYCSVSAGVHIYTHDTVAWALSGGVMAPRTGPVAIGERVYIGSQTVVRHGIVIGSGSVIGANSYVNANVAPGTVVAGSPARCIGHVEGDDYRLVFNADMVPPPDLVGAADRGHGA